MKKIVLITWILGMALMTSSCRKEVLSDHQIEVDSAEEVHTEEIVFSPEDAKAAGVVSEPVVSGEFYGVIPVGGQILEAPGDFRPDLPTQYICRRRLAKGPHQPSALFLECGQ